MREPLLVLRENGEVVPLILGAVGLTQLFRLQQVAEATRVHTLEPLLSVSNSMHARESAGPTAELLQLASVNASADVLMMLSQSSRLMMDRLMLLTSRD